MPRNVRLLGALALGAGLVLSLWLGGRALLGPAVPTAPAGVELGLPGGSGPVARGAPERTTSPGPGPTPTAGPEAGPEAEVDAGRADATAVRSSTVARRPAEPLVVAPEPVPLRGHRAMTLVAAPVHEGPAEGAIPATAAAATPPVPAPTPPPPTAPPTASTEVGACAMPEQAGHGLARAGERSARSLPTGQHRRGCHVPEPADRPRPADTGPQPAAVAPARDADHPGRGGGKPGEGRGRGPKR